MNTLPTPSRGLFAPTLSCALALLFLLSTSGCQLWVKRGAGAGALNQDQAACTASTGASDGGDFNACMTAKGWYRNGVGAADPAAGSATGSPAGAATSETVPAAAHHPASSSAATSGAAAAGPAPAPASTMADTMDATGTKTASTPAAPAPAPVPPSTVNSWWKMGGGPDQMLSARQDCGSKTGDNPASGTYSAGFITCMREAGWHPMR